MTDDLKHKFEQLVADPPPPSAVPSEAVFARVRSVRRRRTAGVVTLAAAAVVAVAVAAGNLTDINSEPPVTGSSKTVVTGSPTATTTGSTAGASAGPTSTTTRTTPVQPAVQPPLAVGIALKPTVRGRTVTMNVTVSGTVLAPTADGQNLPSDTSFLDLSGGTTYDFGDGHASGSDGGSVQCAKSKKRTTGRETFQVETHTYAKPGRYTFHYTVEYCGTNGWFNSSKTTELVIR